MVSRQITPSLRALLRKAGLALLICLGASAAAQRSSERVVVASGTNIDWSYAQNEAPIVYRIGDVRLTVRGIRSGDADELTLVRPAVSVAVPGFAPVVVEGSDSSATFEHRISVGRWEGQRPYVMLQSFTGGAHCCNLVQLVIPEGNRLRAVELGQWDGGYLDALPIDLDGDGRLDFVFVDNRFLYAFASYADSYAPPQIINLIDGRREDVSNRPGFRPLFETAFAEQRRACVAPSEDRVVNGACAAFVASATRLGRFDQAWAEMLRAYDRNSDWELPVECRVPSVNGLCPEADSIVSRDYPTALRAFLVRNDYIPR